MADYPKQPFDARDDAFTQVTRQRFLTKGGTSPNVAVATSATSTTVTMPSAEPDTGYGVAISPSWKTAFSVRGKTTTQFVVDWDIAAPANSTFDWVVFRSERSKPAAVAGGGGGGGGGGGTAVDDASMVQAQHVFHGPPTYVPDLRAGADISLTKDAQGTTIAVRDNDLQIVGFGNLFRQQPPPIPDVRAGANITVTRDAQGYVIAGSGSGGAPVGASYVVIALDGTLTNERTLSAAGAIQIVDSGANSPVTVSLTLEDQSLRLCAKVFGD